MTVRVITLSVASLIQLSSINANRASRRPASPSARISAPCAAVFSMEQPEGIDPTQRTNASAVPARV
jgi:hypothetical protein